jgi:hypothetical protein
MKVRVEKLKQWSPFDNYVWNCKPTVELVRRAIEKGQLDDEPWGKRCDRMKSTLKYHVERIAFLVVNRDETPLSVDVGVPSLGLVVHWPLDDGHHRLAAAIYRGDELIEIDPAGDHELIEKMFDVVMPKEESAA